MMGASYTGMPHIFGSGSDFVWEERFTWWPRRSEESGKRLWMTKAWYGHRLVWGPAGESPVRIEQWLTDEEYMWFRLTNDQL